MFKVGDKVKLIGKVFWIDRFYTNKVGIIVEVNLSGAFRYTVNVGIDKIPVDEQEIEKVNIEGQMLFSFMSEAT